jgi:WD40-like Beta Propeller Repeat
VDSLKRKGRRTRRYTVEARGGAPQWISATGHRTMAHPVFSHDGRWIYFIPGGGDGSVDAFRMLANGGEAFQITRHGGMRPEESPDGKLLYFEKNSTRGLWSAPVSGGEERQVLDSITGMNWTVASRGIYYLVSAVEPGAPQPGPVLQFQNAQNQPGGHGRGGALGRLFGHFCQPGWPMASVFLHH